MFDVIFGKLKRKPKKRRGIPPSTRLPTPPPPLPKITNQENEEGNSMLTSGEKKKYLAQYRDNVREIARSLEDIKKWTSIAEGTQSPGCTSGSSGNNINKQQFAVEMIMDLRDKIEKQIAERIKLKDEIETVIGNVKDHRLQLILHYRYIDGWTFEQIAAEMNYSYVQICRIHGKALEKIML